MHKKINAFILIINSILAVFFTIFFDIEHKMFNLESIVQEKYLFAFELLVTVLLVMSIFMIITVVEFFVNVLIAHPEILSDNDDEYDIVLFDNDELNKAKTADKKINNEEYKILL